MQIVGPIQVCIGNLVKNIFMYERLHDFWFVLLKKNFDQKNLSIFFFAKGLDKLNDFQGKKIFVCQKPDKI